ncbi:uncharacterized protein [Aphelocoma coerulescens]|uniref:uncharacterized protein n=1 Tax=Aphelocoma coerulescens TaxID=39617 RepID=UPI0036051F6A
MPDTSPQIPVPASKSRYLPPNPGTRPQIPVPAPKPQALISEPQAPAPKSRCKPQAGLRVAGPRPRPRPHLPDRGARKARSLPGALPSRRAPFQARSREHAERSKLPPPAAPRPLSAPQPMAAQGVAPLTNGDAEGVAAQYNTQGTARPRPVPGWAGPAAN